MEVTTPALIQVIVKIVSHNKETVSTYYPRTHMINNDHSLA